MKRSVSYIVYTADSVLRRGKTITASSKEEAKTIIENEWPESVVIITSNREVK
jgi:hypothetical protein